MKDRALSLGASVLLDGALSGYGLREKDMTYDKEKNGKPCFPGHFPFHFSISHSGTMAALAVSDRPVGCDIQIEKEADIRLAERFFAPAETAYVEAASDPRERDRRFFRCWALKESFAKALGDGLGRPMGSYAVVDEKGRAICPAMFEIPYAFTEIPVPGYAFAVSPPRETLRSLHVVETVLVFLVGLIVVGGIVIRTPSHFPQEAGGNDAGGHGHDGHSHE